MKRYTVDECEVLREAQEAAQREMAADLARQHGGKFRHAKGTDAFGHPIILVADAKGCDVAEVHQRP